MKISFAPGWPPTEARSEARAARIDIEVEEATKRLEVLLSLDPRIDLGRSMIDYLIERIIERLTDG